MPLSDAELMRLLDLDERCNHNRATTHEVLAFRAEQRAVFRALVEEVQFCRREMALAGIAATAAQEEIARLQRDADLNDHAAARERETIEDLRGERDRLRAVNAKLVEACEAAFSVLGFHADERSTRIAIKCRAAIAAAKE